MQLLYSLSPSSCLQDFSKNTWLVTSLLAHAYITIGTVTETLKVSLDLLWGSLLGLSGGHSEETGDAKLEALGDKGWRTGLFPGLIFSVLGIEPRASGILSKRSIRVPSPATRAHESHLGQKRQEIT